MKANCETNEELMKSFLNMRNLQVLLFVAIQLGTIACKTQTKTEAFPDDNYKNYPQELITYIRNWSLLHNSAERISETYVEIDQLACYDNIQLIKNRIIKEPCRLMVVVKSDAYGNGIEHIGKVSEYAGVDYYGITENKEIIKLRSLGINIPIMRIRLASYQELKTVHSNPELFGEVEEMVGNLQMAKYLSEIAANQNRIIKVHINLNSGEMSRNSFDMHIPQTRDSISSLLKLENINVTGIMTHFANADAEDLEGLRNLLSEFLDAAEWIVNEGALKKEDVIFHAAATALALRLPESHLDMVRLGSVIYGEKIVKESPYELKPVMSLYSSVGQIMFYPKGSKVGYGSIHQLEQDSYLANIPIGKNNGLPKNIKNALITGQQVPLVGAMSMNTTMIDVTHLSDKIKCGDEVVFIGTQGDQEISAEDIWESTGVDQSTMHCNIGQLNYENRYPKKLDD